MNPEQQGHPGQPYRLSGRPDDGSGRSAAEEELLLAQSAPSGVPAAAVPPPPIFVRKKRFEGLAWTALVLGIVGMAAGVASAIVGSDIVVLKYLTIGLAAVGALLGVIALVGTRKFLAAVAAVLCAAAIAVATTAQVARADSEDTAGDAAAHDVVLHECSVARQNGVVKAEAKIEITNHTDTRQSYNISITVNDKDGPRVGEISAIATAVAPGQSVVLSGADASGTVSGRAQPGPADCRIAGVNRLALGG